MSLYALSQRAGETYDAAGKAMRDVYKIIEQKNGRLVWSVPKHWPKACKVLDLVYLFFFLNCKLKKGDAIFYSLPENQQKIKMLAKYHKRRGYQIICFINDLNAFRYGNADSPEVKAHMRQEAALIGCADDVLMPNENTGRLLRENGIESRLHPVGVWDYLMEEEPVANPNFMAEDMWQGQETGQIFTGTHIAFAGNLNKSVFLTKLPFDGSEGIILDLWGKLDDATKQKLSSMCLYHGVLPAEEVPQAVCGMNYGLVWDGDGADEIEGGLGEYLQYNNSHKCGLYLASGVPAIVWSRSGMASFVKANQCGICIDRLSDIPVRIQSVDYTVLKENAQRVGKKLRHGEYLSEAFDKCFIE